MYAVLNIFLYEKSRVLQHHCKTVKQSFITLPYSKAIKTTLTSVHQNCDRFVMLRADVRSLLTFYACLYRDAARGGDEMLVLRDKYSTMADRLERLIDAFRYENNIVFASVSVLKEQAQRYPEEQLARCCVCDRSLSFGGVIKDGDLYCSGCC